MDLVGVGGMVEESVTGFAAIVGVVVGGWFLFQLVRWGLAWAGGVGGGSSAPAGDFSGEASSSAVSFVSHDADLPADVLYEERESLLRGDFEPEPEKEETLGIMSDEEWAAYDGRWKGRGKSWDEIDQDPDSVVGFWRRNKF
jgi:hypothetical protein